MSGFYPGKRTLPAIIQWLKRQASPDVPVLNSVDAVAQFIDSHQITIVGFFEVSPQKIFKKNHVFIFIFVIKEQLHLH